MATFFVNLPPYLIGMEARGSAHYWARKLQAMGHDVRLMAQNHSFNEDWHRPQRTVASYYGGWHSTLSLSVTCCMGLRKRSSSGVM